MTKSFKLLTGATLALVGCGGGDEGIPVAELHATLEVVTGAPSMPGEAPQATALTAADAVSSLGAMGTMLVVGTPAGAFEIAGEALVPMEIWGDEPERPVDTGAVQAIARRTDNLLVAADNGFFHTDGSRLLWSPASAELDELAVVGMAVTGSDESEIVWIAASDGLYQLAGGNLARWTLDGESGSPTAVLDAGDRLLVAFGDALYEIDTAAAIAWRVPLELGAVHAMALGPGGIAWLATDAGLVARNGAAYTLHTLSADESGVAVADVALDPKEGLYAATAIGVVVVRADGALDGMVPLEPPAESRRLTTDDAGNVWLGEGTAVTGWTLGTPISFETDVSPVFEQYCMPCHTAPGANEAPPVDFLDHEVAVSYRPQVTQRLATGLMPPASATPLPAESYELILRWYASGANP
jgi:hypothetical protein